MKFQTHSPGAAHYIDASAFPNSVRVTLDGKEIDNACGIDEECGYVDVRTATGIKRTPGIALLMSCGKPMTDVERAVYEKLKPRMMEEEALRDAVAYESLGYAHGSPCGAHTPADAVTHDAPHVDARAAPHSTRPIEVNLERIARAVEAIHEQVNALAPALVGLSQIAAGLSWIDVSQSDMNPGVAQELPASHNSNEKNG